MDSYTSTFSTAKQSVVIFDEFSGQKHFAATPVAECVILYYDTG